MALGGLGTALGGGWEGAWGAPVSVEVTWAFPGKRLGGLARVLGALCGSVGRTPGRFWEALGRIVGVSWEISGRIWEAQVGAQQGSWSENPLIVWLKNCCFLRKIRKCKNNSFTIVIT